MALLMCRDTVVYETITKRVVNKALLPFRDSYETWRGKRVYVISNIDARNEDLCLPDNAVEKRRRLSLSDCYWIKHNSDRTAGSFNEMTPYRNEFTTFALTHRGASSPDLVTGGSMCKHWERADDGGTVLCKSGKCEWVFAEYKALETARALGFNVGECRLRTAVDGTSEILLSNLSDERNMLLTFGSYGEKCNGYSAKSAAEAYARIGVNYDKALSYALCVILFDALTGNYDRKSNMGNWGFYKDSSTGMVSLSPVFDFNLCHINQRHMFVKEVIRNLAADGLSEQAFKIMKRWLGVAMLDVWRENGEEFLHNLEDN